MVWGMLWQLAGIRLAFRDAARTIARGRRMQRTLAATLLAAVTLTMTSTCAAAEPGPTFRAHGDQVITQKFVGFGGQMNPYLWCRPNADVVTEPNASDLEKKILALAP